MKSLTVVMLAIIALTPAKAYARLGETLEQCTKRYGKHLHKSKRGIFLFSKQGFNIYINFVSGKAGSITIRKTKKDILGVPHKLTDNEKDILLKANSQGKKWSDKKTVGLNQMWMRSDRAMALYNPNDRMLIISTMEALELTVKATKAKEKKKLEGF